MPQFEEPASLQFRPMVHADLARVYAIECMAYQDPWSLKLLEESLQAAMTYSLVAERAIDPVRRGPSSPSRDISMGDGVVGYSIFQVIFTEGHLLNLAVDRSFHRVGVGRRLLNETLRISSHYGALRFFLEVRPSNEAAIHLYKGEGFEQITLREKYYSNGEDAIVMVKDLL